MPEFAYSYGPVEANEPEGFGFSFRRQHAVIVPQAVREVLDETLAQGHSSRYAERKTP